jgi:hypothetical protein
MSVCGGLLLMVTGILLTMVLTAVNSLRLAERRAAVQRNALVLAGRLGQELKCAHPDSLVVAGDLTFLSSRGLRFSPAGQLLWVRWLNVVLRPDHRVVLREWPITVPTSPPYLTPPGAGVAGWRESSLAAWVQSLDFQLDGHGAVKVRLVTSFEGCQYELNTVFAGG